MNYEECCYKCGRYGTELHHIIKKSQVSALRECKLNHIYICPDHHRGTNGVHGKLGYALDKKLRLKFQNELEICFDCRFITYSTIKETLQINDKQLKKLLKTVNMDGQYYERESLIRACMGGRLEIDE